MDAGTGPRHRGVMPRFSTQDLIEIAMCCRLGARKAREEAQTRSDLSTHEILEQTAEYREELGRRIQSLADARKGDR